MSRHFRLPALLVLFSLLVSLGLAACGATAVPTPTLVPPTATPAPSTPPTVATPGTPSSQATAATTGSVRVGSTSGPGLSGVTICFSLANDKGRSVGLTDATGTYSALYPTIPQGRQETATVWAELAGYRFDPPGSAGILYGGATARPITATFIAHTASPAPAASAAAPCNRSASELNAPSTSIPSGAAPLTLTAMDVTKYINADKTPRLPNTTFEMGSEVYITFTARQVQPGQRVVLKLYRDGVPLQLMGINVVAFNEQATTLHGYFTFAPSEGGFYAAELYINDETQPSSSIKFSVVLH